MPKAEPTGRATKAAAKTRPAKAGPAETAAVETSRVRAAPAKAVKAAPAKAARAAPAKTVRAAPAKTVRPAPAKAAKTAKAAPTSTGRASATEWSTTELADIRAGLSADIARMKAEYEYSMTELDQLQQGGTDGAGDDQADAGSKTFDREQELSIAANRFDLLSQMMRAVERLDRGTYGLCENCGRPIPRARLHAFPMATLDVACKLHEERR